MANKETASFNWWLYTPSESILRMIDLNYKLNFGIIERRLLMTNNTKIIDNNMSITLYSDYVGKRIYGESILNYRELYVYTIIGCGDFLGVKEDALYPRIIIRNDTPTRDCMGHSFPIGKYDTIYLQEIHPDEIGVKYFFSETEASENIANKYRNVDTTEFDGKKISDLQFHKLQTECNNDGYNYYYLKYPNFLCSKPIDNYGNLEWYLCRRSHFGDKRLFGHSSALEGHVIHVDTKKVNFWD